MIISEYQIALSQIDKGESKNQGAETSGPTLETPRSKNLFKNSNLIISEYQIALGQIDNGEFKNHGADTSGPTLETLRCKNYWKIPIL